jgi:expansin (peptidoglycan-binding protein)
MSSKEAIEKIKNMLFGEMPVQAPAPVPTPVGSGQTFADYKLKDGTVVSIDKVEIGGQVVEQYSLEQSFIYQQHHIKEEMRETYNKMIGQNLINKCLIIFITN